MASGLLRNSRKTERGAKQLLASFVVRAAPFALLRKSRKTEARAVYFYGIEAHLRLWVGVRRNAG